MQMLAHQGSPEWLTFVGLAAGFVAFIVGLWQYRIGQRWKRAEFVAQEVKGFLSDPQVVMALTLLDYSAVKLDTSGKFAYGRKPDNDLEPQRDGVCWMNDESIISSLRNHMEFKDQSESFNDKETLCRFAFDALLTGLERFNHFVDARLVTYAELRPHLSYWVRVMADPKSQWKDPAFYLAIRKFIRSYGYAGVESLCAGMGYPLTT